MYNRKKSKSNGFNAEQPPYWEAAQFVCEYYFPRKRVTAAPSAKIPVRYPHTAPPKLTPNADKPANRKNRSMNQVERLDGVFMYYVSSFDEV